MPEEYRQVEAIDQLPDIKFDEEKLVDWLLRQRNFMYEDRERWLARQRKYLGNWDDYLSYSRKGMWDNAANFHLPLTMEKVKTLHARFKQALFAVRPWWQLMPIEKLDIQRIKTIDTVMRWAVENYVNGWKGIESAIDDWLWDCVTVGWSVMKRRWELKQRKAIIVEKVEKEQGQIEASFDQLQEEYDRSQGKPAEVEVIGKEVEKLLTYFDGPMLEPLPHEDILFPAAVKDVSDLNEPFLIGHDFKLDESGLHTRINNGLYFEEATKDILGRGLDEPGQLGNISDLPAVDSKKLKEDQYRGVDTVNAKAGVKEAKLVECYFRYDLDNDGVDEELVAVMSLKARRIARITYLDRITKTGRRPFHKIDLIRRPRNAYSIGLLELLYPLNKEIDAMHNMRIDFGMLTNVPFFFFRPMSGMKGEKIKLEPGMGYPIDDPQRDINFPRMANATAWGMQEEMSLVTWSDRLTSMSAMNVGMPAPAVGASRTASGMMALLNESNMNLDVMLSRVKYGYADVLKGVLADMQERMPDDLKIRVIGADGRMQFGKDGESLFIEPTRLDIAGRLDFIITANSANSNRELEKQNAILYSQMLLNPIALQTGIVSPREIYNVFRNILEKHGIMDIDSFVREPQIPEMPLPLYDEIAAITQGLVPRMVLHDNHQAKIAGLLQFSQEPAFLEGIKLGVNSPNSMQALNIAVETHRKMAKAISAQAQAANTTGLQISPTMGARMTGQVGETGRPLPQENIPKGQMPASAGGPSKPMPPRVSAQSGEVTGG